MDKKHERSLDTLIGAASKGDETAAAKLYGLHAGRVYRICYRIALDDAKAQDCSQEAWIKIFKNLHRFRLGSSFESWISAIAANCTIDAVRKSARTRAVSTETINNENLVSTERPARDRLEDREIHAQIEQSLGELSVQQRAAFVLRHFEGEPLSSIAETLECSTGTVKTHIYRAVQALRKDLSDYARNWDKNR